MKFGETGTQGLEEYDGFISEAYNTKLFWPGCYDDYNRIRRSDPEITLARQGFITMARQVTLDVELHDDANDAERKYQDFLREVLDDIDGGPGELLEAAVSYVPFLGWAWWNAVPGLRRAEWRPPGGDDWRSKYNDNRIGIRRFGWRDHSSFHKWDMDKRGRVRGLVQIDGDRKKTTIPARESLHLTFGDPYNPEGMALLEAIWRLERIKYGLEIIQGIGYEHAAGHLSVTADRKLGDGDETAIARAARNILTAQEGNYATWPAGFTGEVKDIPFAAGASILEAIRYYGILKLQVFFMQFISVATTAGTGAYSAHSDSREAGIDAFNGMMKGFAKQIENQIGGRIWEWNKGAFPGVVNRPRIVVTAVEKTIPLETLGAFMQAISAIVPLDDDDLIAVRRKSQFLPETLADDGAPKPEPDSDPDPAGDDPDDDPLGEFASRPVVLGPDEHPTNVTFDAAITPEDIEGAFRRFGSWAKEEDPLLWGLLNAKIEKGDATD